MAEFPELIPEPTPEEKRAQADAAMRQALERTRFAMVCTADVCAGFALEMARSESRHLDRMASVAMVAGTALSAAEKAGQLLAAMPRNS